MQKQLGKCDNYLGLIDLVLKKFYFEAFETLQVTGSCPC